MERLFGIALMIVFIVKRENVIGVNGTKLRVVPKGREE